MKKKGLLWIIPAKLAAALICGMVLAGCASIFNTGKGSAIDANRAQEYSAKGIEAEQSGKIVAALFYYFSAYDLDQNSAKAKNKAVTFARKVISGDPWGLQGNEAQKKIELKKRWPALAEESRQFFTENPPVLSLSEIRFTSGSPFQESLDYEKETATYSCNVLMVSLIPPLNAVDTCLREGWRNTGIGGEFPVSGGPIPEIDTAGYYIWQKLYTLQVELVNGEGKTIATSPVPPETLKIMHGRDGVGDFYSIVPNRDVIDKGDDAQLQASVPFLGFYGSNLKVKYGIEYMSDSSDSRTWLTNRPQSALPTRKRYSPFTFVVSVNDITDKGMSVKIKKVYEYGLNRRIVDGPTATLLRTIDIP